MTWDRFGRPSRSGRFSRPAAAAAFCAAGGLVALVPAVPAGAIDDSHGSPGFCPDDDGVTVVVDFQQLGATTIVRCASGSQTRSGLEVLQDAGFQVEGVQRWGEGFVCRIENRPSAAEPLSVPGSDQYREACVDTPPSSAFWSYWRADEGGEWQYSQQGVKSSAVEPGDYVGWSFSLGAGGGENSAPRVPPLRPDAEKAAAGGAVGESKSSSTEPAWTGGDGAPDGTEDGAAQGAADGAVWSSALGLGAVATVAVVAAAMSLRRRRRGAQREPLA